MRTKTLLIAAAALVAGIISSEAQPVYSANVVGYVNVAIPANQLVLLANPLDDGTNTVTSLGGALPNKSTVSIFSGGAYVVASKGAGAWNTNLSIPVGTGFFVKSPTALTNVFTGNVAVAPGSSTTNSLPSGTLELVGSTIPFSGDLNDTNLNLGPSLPNKSTISVYNGTAYIVASKGAGAWNTNLPIAVAQGYFIKSQTATNWTQTLQP